MRTRPQNRRTAAAPVVTIFLLALLALSLLAVHFRQTHPPLPDRALTVQFLDVGEGDAALLLTPDGAVLIDTGPAESRAVVRRALRPYRQQLRALIVTHAHADHAGDALWVLKHCTPPLLLLPFPAETEAEYEALLAAAKECGTEVLFAAAGHAFSLGGADFTVLAPLYDAEAMNDDSLVVRVDFGETSFLFTGDAEAESEARQLAAFGGEPGGRLDTDVVKLGHHGSSTSSGDGYLAAVTPGIAVISVGENRYGHPSAPLLARLEEDGVRVARTDRLGTVTVTSDGVSLTVTP